MQENVVNKPQASRVTTTTAQVQANYDRLSRFYDLLAASELPYIELGLQLLDLGAGETVLEIGSGTGRALLPMAQAVGGTGRVCGLDISPGMLLAAQEKIDPAGLGPRLQLVCGGASALPYPTHTFDALFMSFTLELFDNPHIPLVLAGCRRVLKENGRICVVSLSRAAPPNLAVRLYEWAHRRFPLLVDCRPIYLHEALLQAGFLPLQTLHRSMWTLPLEIILSTPAPRTSHTARRT